jgi:hypothetical protein
MAQEKEQRTRPLVKKADATKLPDRVRQVITLKRRTSGILSFYAKTRSKCESEVVEDALRAYFEGWRIGDPEDRAGEGETAA